MPDGLWTPFTSGREEVFAWTAMPRYLWGKLQPDWLSERLWGFFIDNYCRIHPLWPVQINQVSPSWDHSLLVFLKSLFSPPPWTPVSSSSTFWICAPDHWRSVLFHSRERDEYRRFSWIVSFVENAPLELVRITTPLSAVSFIATCTSIFN